MFVSPAYAQAAGAGAGGSIEAFLPLILIFVVFYFLLIRPQQKKMKMHREMLASIRRGDKIITGGGIMATVTKVDNEGELTVEIAPDVRVKVQRSTISMVLNRTEPVPGKAANDSEKKGGLLAGLFGGGAKPAAQPAPQPEPEPEPEAAKDAPEGEKKDDEKR